MYEEGTIIKFTPFYFKNGNKAKDKYFVVLKCLSGDSILASLPTSVDSIPEKEVIKNGCLELPEINLNCFVISEDTEITTNGKRFDVPTHIYGHQMDSYELELLNTIQNRRCGLHNLGQNEKWDFSKIDKLSKNICFCKAEI